ncbi:MAG: hypothetical protein FJ044_01465 [Candidatus Cloacimonetes bacterium]|nr:hypothetical protein [Candidatus Cloacimonadota bacterium]
MKNNLLIWLIVIAIIIAGYFVFQNFSTNKSATNTTQEQQLQIGNYNEEITDSEVAQQSDINSKFCNTDDDCGLLICSGCFSKEFLKTAPPDLPCRQYEGYSCECVENKCTEVE